MTSDMKGIKICLYLVSGVSQCLVNSRGWTMQKRSICCFNQTSLRSLSHSSMV